MILKVQKLVNNAVLPSFAHNDDAGLDLTVTSIKKKSLFKVSYGFGIAVEIPEGHYGKLASRSSVHKKYLFLANGVGIIDSPYRGELQAVFYRIPFISKLYQIGDRAAQLIVTPIPKIDVVPDNTLTTTERGTGGFGSSDKK